MGEKKWTDTRNSCGTESGIFHTDRTRVHKHHPTTRQTAGGVTQSGQLTLCLSAQPMWPKSSWYIKESKMIYCDMKKNFLSFSNLVRARVQQIRFPAKAALTFQWGLLVLLSCVCYLMVCLIATALGFSGPKLACSPADCISHSDGTKWSSRDCCARLAQRHRGHGGQMQKCWRVSKYGSQKVNQEAILTMEWEEVSASANTYIFYYYYYF